MNFHGEKRSNETHQSTTDPEARLARKGNNQPAKLSYLANALMENRHRFLLGLGVEIFRSSASETEGGVTLLDHARRRLGYEPTTYGADKGFFSTNLIRTLLERRIAPHIATDPRGRQPERPAGTSRGAAVVVHDGGDQRYFLAGRPDTGHSCFVAVALGERFGSDLAVFCGTDSDFVLALEHHAAGCITAPANLISPGLREIYDAFMSKRNPSAAQAKVREQRHALEQLPPFPPTLKALLSRMCGQPRWPVRPPLVEASEEELDRLQSQLV